MALRMPHRQAAVAWRSFLLVCRVAPNDLGVNPGAGDHLVHVDPLVNRVGVGDVTGAEHQRGRPARDPGGVRAVRGSLEVDRATGLPGAAVADQQGERVVHGSINGGVASWTSLCVTRWLVASSERMSFCRSATGSIPGRTRKSTAMVHSSGTAFRVRRPWIIVTVTEGPVR